MADEIEHKFLVVDDSWRRSAAAGTPFRQGYLSVDPERTVRVRIAGDRAFLTVKGGSRGAVRSEFEFPIPVEDATEMLNHLCVSPLIEKTRYVVRFADRAWEVDEFHGVNEGLLVAEVELRSVDEAFEVPPWAGDDVTEDARYYNAALVDRPYSTW